MTRASVLTASVLAASFAAFVALAPAVAVADAMPDCPPGTKMMTNPVPEGAMHHNGAQCVDEDGDEGRGEATGGGCGVSPGAAPSGLGALLAWAALGWVRRRR